MASSLAIPEVPPRTPEESPSSPVSGDFFMSAASGPDQFPRLRMRPGPPRSGSQATLLWRQLSKRRRLFGGGNLVATQKERPPKRAPSPPIQEYETLHLLRTFFGRVVPHAASLFAASFVSCFCNVVLSEGRASEGKCQGQRERRNERFHGVTPYVCIGTTYRTPGERHGSFPVALVGRHGLTECTGPPHSAQRWVVNVRREP